MATSGSKKYTGTLGDITVAWSVKSSSAIDNAYKLNITVTFKNKVSYRVWCISNDFGVNDTSAYPTFWPSELQTFSAVSGATVSKTVELELRSDEHKGASSEFDVGEFWFHTEFSPDGVSVSETCVVTQSITNLPKIDRVSVPTVPSSITINSQFRITFNRIDNEFYHSVSLKVGSRSFQEIDPIWPREYTNITLPLNPWATYITTSSSSAATVRVYTYHNSEVVGYKDVQVTLIVPSNLVPSISNISYQDNSEQNYLSIFGGFLNTLSVCHLNWSETISYSSAITTRQVSVSGVSVPISNVSSSGCDIDLRSISLANNTATITIKDGRSRTATGDTLEFLVYNYFTPVVGNSMVFRSDENGDSLFNGDHISVVVPWTKASLPDVNNDEQNFVKLLVKIDGQLIQTYGSDSVDAPNGAVITLPGTFSDTQNYQIELIVEDTVGKQSYYRTSISSVSRPLSVRAFIDQQQGTKTWGMAVGKVAERPDALELGVPVYTVAETVSELFFYTSAGGSTSWIRAYAAYDSQSQAVSYGNNMVICPQGNLILGGGESAASIYSNNIESVQGTSELAVLASDSTIIFFSNCNTISDRKRMAFQTNGNVLLSDGAYYTKDDTAVIGTVPSSQISGRGLFVQDSAGTTLGYVRSRYYTDGRVGVYMEATRSVSGTSKYNTLQLSLDTQGNANISVGGTGVAAAWRSAIGAVNISGDTMSGNLEIEKANPCYDGTSTNIDAKIGQTIPSSNTALGSCRLYDKQGELAFYSQTFKTTADDLYTSFVTRRLKANGDVISNGFYQHIYANGTYAITFSGGGKNAWLSGLGLNGAVSENNISSTNVATATDVTMGNTGSLAAGTYIITYRVAFAANTTGRRCMYLTTSTSSTSPALYSRIQEAPSPNSTTELIGTAITTITSATTYYLRAYQQSGSTLACTGQLRILKIHD